MRRLIYLLIILYLAAPISGAAVEVVNNGGFLIIPEGEVLPEAEPEDGHTSRSAASSYSMKVVVSMPTGSAGASLSSTQPSNTKLSACSDAAKVDAVTFTLTYSAGSPADKDVYMILFNPNADGTGSPKFYMIKKGILTSPATVTTRNNVANIVAASDIYLAKASNTGSSVTETLLGGSIIVDGAPSGTWQVVGIVADNTTVNFDDPLTWTAWDVGTFVLRKPWVGSANTTCQ